MNLVYYTNCQYSGLDYFLKQQIHNLNSIHIENYTLIKNKNKIPIDILKNSDIFIYQPINKNHGIYSTDKSIPNNIMTYLPSKCKIISFPYIYCDALWILIRPAEIDALIGSYDGIYKYINKEPIENLKSKGFSLDEVLEMYNQNSIDFDYKNRFNKSIEILKNKEEICDIKVSEFIKTNIKRHKLFLTQNHPTSYIFIHCVNQILLILGIDYKYNEFSFPENIGKFSGDYPHTTYDAEYWKFEYKINIINNNWYIDDIKTIFNNI